MTELYTVKHLADRVANEPRNVGVIATTGHDPSSRVALRFLGIDLDGTAARKPLPGVSKDVYISWVDYFRSKTRSGRWEDIARAHRRRPQDFYLEHALTILDSDDVERLADEYFPRLVQTAAKKRRSSEVMRQQVDDVFRELGLAPDRNVPIEAHVNDKNVRVSFGYALSGDRPVLFDVLPTHGLGANGQAFAYRTMVAQKAEVSKDFAAFIDLENVSDEQDLRAVESVATVIDPVGDFAGSVETVAALTRA
ncbi:hypothetical protein DRB06_08975 [Actinomyces sp. Z5]|uniref:DUF1828 domain-containing protein n=1 Tax=Actinomyces glycerinitolerans TaxID=1892869 RepID=A0A1M4RZ39_9ACTO|nr:MULTISPECIES: hypothetical protein [Actinomyces]RAX20334.1 hypothetical protein DRB06_08975 [Actinomyces sp. Z5]SHE25189.1 Hypothetical protein ACGLYG10_1405 [Actinomyces glycerinitolerans]